MRTPNLGTMNYSAGQLPTNPEDLIRFLQTELIKIQSALESLSAGHVDAVYASPRKPREGDFRLADGTQWDPGSGKGFYGYYNSAWHLLG